MNVENLRVKLGKKEVLKGISLNIKPNSIVAIIGPSGCGKSTFLKCINGILNDNVEAKIEGKIEFQGKDIKDYDSIDDVRKNIGMVFQNPTPFPMSIYKNITYAMKYYGENKKEILDKVVEEKLRVVGLYEEVSKELNKSALKLSGGQQQRLCIARALAIEPKILLLDEPCSALDIKSTMIIEDMLKELSKEYTIIIVTHNLNQAKRISDNTVFMLDGNIVEDDKTEKIFTEPKDDRTRDYISGIYG
ncbi:phosphate ABC transporter ATP-binding protein, PhoT family [Clostridium collagenovorans DSM 3089]|uniref:Phosphate ABC transporter ATP-binding protein, PhoT family n=1 Tax=Clostridium collagenovorans DSM 3089 TaxID=1121306 RepID=A0A1M5XW67_9CLOT|nr:phosphate ABC transporter ATP-binding protein, PhoT family [Clostridium collagenovorans DSM 3089]